MITMDMVRTQSRCHHRLVIMNDLTPVIGGSRTKTQGAQKRLIDSFSVILGFYIQTNTKKIKVHFIKEDHIHSSTTNSVTMFKPRYANKSFARLTIPAIAASGLVGTYLYYRTPAANPSTGGQAQRTREKRDKEALSGAAVGGNAMSGGHEAGQPGSGIQPGTGDVERDPQTTASKDKLPEGGVGGGYGGGNSNVRAIDMSAKKETKSDITDSMSGPSSGGGSKQLPAKPGSSNSSGSGGDNNGGSSGDSGASSAASLRSRSGADSNDKSGGYEDSEVKYRAQTYPSSSKDHKPNSETTATEGTSLSQRLQGAFGQGGSSSEGYTMDRKKFGDTRIHSNHGDTPTKRHQMRSDS